MKDEFLEKYCAKHQISEEEAIKHRIVQDYFEYKRDLENELSKMQRKDVSSRQ